MRLFEQNGTVPGWPEFNAPLRVSAASRTSNQQLAALFEQVQGATRDLQLLALGRSEADLTACPEPGAWSVAECVDHLAQTTRAFLPAISDAIATAPLLITERALRTGTLAQLFIRNLEPPYRLRFKVLRQITPQHHDFETAWNGFLESQSRLLETVRSTPGLAIDQVKIKSPVYARIRYNVYGAIRMLAAHERRHIWQIKQILAAIDLRQSAGGVA